MAKFAKIIKRFTKSKQKGDSLAGLTAIGDVPRAIKDDVSSRFANTFSVSESCSMTKEQIKARGSQYFWHYPIAIDDIFFESDFEQFTGIDGRHFMRYNHFFSHVVAKAGGSLAGKTILDCGANCGFWSIQAANNGAESIVAFDASEKNIEQAEFLKEIIGVPQVEYKVADLDNFTDVISDKFDITFFLGLLYHLNRPVEILRALRSVTKEFAVVDTTIDPGCGSYMRVMEDFAHDQNKCNNLCFLPTAKAVNDLLLFAGFSRVEYIPNDSAQLPEDYATGKRITFLAYC